MTATTIRVQMAQRKDTAANWTAANPILLSGEIGYETDTKKFKIGDGTTNWNSLAYLPIPDGSGNLTITGNLEIGSTGSLTFEGSTADGFETTLAVTNPTADRTITLPNQSGNVLVSGNASIVDADIAANAEVAVSKLADGTARQLLQTDAAGTGVEWTSNVDIPGTLDVTGAATFDAAVTVAGDLTVNGTTTTISTQNLLVEDKNIIIGDVASPTDVTADGGGITLKGATDKTINWVDATDAWTSSERFSVPLGTAALPSLTLTGDPNTGIYSPGADQLALSTGGSARLFVDSSGNVGIGDTAPLAQLNILNVSGTNGFYITRGTSTSFGDVVSLRIFTSASDSRFYGYGDAMTFWTAATGGTALERLSITSAGLVGIGTSAPAKNLHISSSSNTALRIADTGTAATTFGQTNGGLELVGGNANTSAKYMPGIKFGSTDSAFTTTTPKFGAAITAEATEAYDADTDGGMSLAFWTTPNDPGTSGSLQQRLIILNSGNVGLGTASPAVPLHLVSNAGLNTPVELFRAGSEGASLRLSITPASAGDVVSEIYAFSGGAGNSSSSALAFKTRLAGVESERARIDSSGRLLVGTSSAVTTSYSSGLIQLATPTGGIIVTSRDDSTVASSTTIGGLSLWSKTTTNHEECASIFAQADGTYADGDKPTRLVFSTTADGASTPTERLRINNVGQTMVNSAGTAAAPVISKVDDSNTGIYFPAADTIAFAEGGSEAARIDSDGRLLIGVSASRPIGGSIDSQQLIESTGVASVAIVQNSNNTTSASLRFGKSRATAVGGTTIVASGDNLGFITFAGADGSDLQSPAAGISAVVDGTPGLDDMPGRLVFSTTADGANSLTERLRITNDGVQAYNQPAPAAVDATATLTVANLKAGIITSTSAAATDMTLPTGTDTEAGFNGVYTNFTFAWSVINTGPSLVRVLAATAHTIVGSGSVATGTSGRFASRRTAANTFVTYRLS